MKSLFLVAAVVACTTVTAQRTNLHRSQVTSKYHYTGVIGGKYKFQMNLTFSDKGVVDGEYRYVTQKSFIQLKGVYVAATKALDLTESAYNPKTQKEEVTGYFKGTGGVDAITGKWYNKDKTKTFDFTLTSGDKSIPDMVVSDNGHIVDGSWKVADSIRIQSVVNKLDQLFIGLDINVSADTEIISFEDINFDGYLDLLVIEMTGAKNTPYLYWVYDPVLRIFEKHDELTASDPIVDVTQKRIISDWADGAALRGQSQFIWQDGKFYLIEESQTDLSTNKSKLTKWKVEAGKRVKVL